MKQHYKPMLAQTADAPFNSEDWIFEIKWDGIRAISYVDNEVSIRSRNDKEMKQNFPEIVDELKTLAKNVVLDGEIVVIKEGKADFQSVIQRARATRSHEIEVEAQRNPATYVVFDMIEKEGQPLLELPLIQRKKSLEQSLRDGSHVSLSLFVEKEGKAYYEAALKKGVEGIMAKKKDSPYIPGVRSYNWLKIKKLATCDCVIFGYTRGEGSRRETFGSLVLGLYEGEKPVYVGNVGTGFSLEDLESLMKTFEELETKERTLPADIVVAGEIVWLVPKLVCEVTYQSVTRDGKLRMARFRTLRLDKKPDECTSDQIKRSSLSEYISKRDFSVTPEPKSEETLGENKIFVVQEHSARRLHYDLRLERQGVLKSWAVPKGIPQKTGDKRLAVQTEDHPFEYQKFEGTIPKGQYGAGTVRIWDKGSYELKIWKDDKIEFKLNGEKLHGSYALVRLKKATEKDWLLMKLRD
jgi:DNA ligase D-like protein (predicted ligase)/DNA ligase D-like protein (predicted 3'-phosphoesterase)